MSAKPNWAETIEDHITKQIAVKGKAVVEMSGLRVEVRQIGGSWLWTIVSPEAQAQDTSLAAGCENEAAVAAKNAATTLAGLIR